MNTSDGRTQLIEVSDIDDVTESNRAEEDGSPPDLSSDLVSDKALESASEDEFQHAPLARLVAQVASGGETPLNIALYGSWGSGKSSFFALLKEQLADSIAVVKYNAWKYSGEALQRRFIADAAAQLDIEIPDLYGSRETPELAPTTFRKRLETIGQWLLTALGPILLVGIVVYVAFAGLLALVTSNSFTGLLTDLATAILAPAAVIAMLVWAGRFLLAESLTRVQSGPPEQEQLEDTFATVLAKARAAKKNLVQDRFDRFVFFVDELDRCASEEVVATLAAIRNFLDQPDCVFIVAADRDVLEVALDKLPQENPANEDAPYYSSASEFLDKIFQTQLSLPPLRDQRRTRFARDLVLSKEGGVWRELRDRGGGVVDDVIFVLIPSHVRSPRRIKVLLNTFAINARTAQARAINWSERATEIAKLTVLETEFPLFAADLHIEPRLPSLVLDGAADKTLSERSLRVLAKHRLGEPPVAQTDNEEEPGEGGRGTEQDDQAVLEPTDRLLTGDRREREALISVQREQLRRYLQTRRSFPDPRPDLLYLEDAGLAFGLEDPSLAMMLELEAPESPALVIGALDGRTPAEITSVVRLLASMVPQQVGPEKDSVLVTMVRASDLLDEDALRRIGGEIAHTVDEFLAAGRTIPTDTLPSTLRTCVLAGAMSASATILRDDRFDKNPALLAEAGRVAPHLGKEDRKALFGRVATAYAEGEDEALLTLIAELPTAEATDLLEQPQIWAAIRTLDQADVEEAFEKLFAAVERRESASPELQRAVQWRALRNSAIGGYAPARKRAAVVLADPANQKFAARHAIVALQTAPSEDWESWGEIAAKAPPTREFNADTRAAVVKLVSGLQAASSTEQQAATTVATAVLSAGGYEPTADQDSGEIAEAMTTTLSSVQWWASTAQTEAQESTHTFALAITEASPGLRPEIETALETDLARSLASAPSAQALEGIKTMGTRLGPEGATRLAALCEQAQPQFPAESLAARLALARAIREAGTDVAASAFGLDEIRSARTAGNAHTLADWLYLEPRSSDVLTLAAELASSASSAEIAAFASWAEAAGPDRRADLLNAVITGTSDGVRWIETVPHPVDEERVVAHLADLLPKLGRHEERNTAVRALIALKPELPAAQRGVADIIVQLLERGKQADFDTALRGIRALRTEHQSKGRLSQALKQACDLLDRKIPSRAVGDLEAAGIQLPEKYLEKSTKRLRKRLGL